jgi:hypothetical protein
MHIGHSLQNKPRLEVGRKAHQNLVQGGNGAFVEGRFKHQACGHERTYAPAESTSHRRENSALGGSDAASVLRHTDPQKCRMRLNENCLTFLGEPLTT